MGGVWEYMLLSFPLHPESHSTVAGETIRTETKQS